MPKLNLRRLVKELKDSVAQAVKDRDSLATQNAMLQGRVLEVEKLSVDEANKACHARCALEVLGLPDLDDPSFDAHVVYTAYKLKRLVPVHRVNDLKKAVKENQVLIDRLQGAVLARKAKPGK